MFDRSAPYRFGDGASVGIGSLPHRNVAAGAAFALAEFDIPTVPSMPHGVDHGDIITEIRADLDSSVYEPLRTFLDLAVTINLDGDPVKWQTVGPVTLGIELIRGGLAVGDAFSTALTMVRSRLEQIDGLITAALPSSPQLVVLDEPWFADLMSPGFAIPPDEAVDLVSSAMAALPASTTVGVHCCAPCDVATLLASGPQVISVPVTDDLVEWAGYLARFLDNGGIVVWGVIPVDGPVASSADRQWRQLSDTWCALVQRGCDPVLLRQQSLVSPACGLATHSAAVARRIARMTRDVGRRVKDQSAATRLSLGA
jgi:hypothetical protein